VTPAGPPMSRTGRALLLPGLLLLVTAGTLLAGALTPRDLSLGEAAGTSGTGDLAAFDFSRAATALAVFASLAAILVTAIREGLPRPGLRVWLAYLVFLVTNAVLPGLAGAVPGLDPRAFYAPLVFTAVYVARPMEAEALVALVKGVLLAFVYGGAAAGVLAPAHGLAWGYEGLVPGLDARLYGLAGGATSLGAQAAAFLAIEWFSPSRSRLRPAHLTVAAVVLLLTQAKTSWLFLVLCLLFRAHRRASAYLAASTTRSPAVARLETVALGLAVFGAGAATALYLGQLDLGEVKAARSLLTFTGRTFVWAASLEVWLESPIFGYGPSLWANEAFRARHGGFGHAHNQFIQALAAAGLIGLAGLLHYLRTALRVSLDAARAGQPAALVLLGLIATLLMMDVPLQGLYLLDAFVLLHLLLFALLIHQERTGPDLGGAAGAPGAPAVAQPPR